ncbi:VOC family protein [Sphingobacterium endophyticum]|uniref:VOC family protein n=1 Tax=Sphingobacterium endophyticum TaxID=2546448 RepID=UPI0012E21DC6|nr:VOC family protein [Sphingobacterium endophyticum]
MAKQVFINLAVKDLAKAEAFYSALGFSNNPQFSDDTGNCMVWSDSIYVMILNHEKFLSFTNKPLADTKTSIAGIYTISVDSVAEMNKIIESGLGAGGKEPNEIRDYGFMQQRTIEDPDGNTWEFFYMDESKFPTE